MRTPSLPAWGEWIEIALGQELHPEYASLPAWGEWIEIFNNICFGLQNRSLPAWGAWIEIRSTNCATGISSGLSPHGESGLKYCGMVHIIWFITSLPAWGEWIEMRTDESPDRPITSLPAWGEWIEIESTAYYCRCALVSPRMGRVD